MAGSSSHYITPKEEPVTLERPESPNIFLPTTQVEFTFDEITFTTNYEEAFTRALNQYKEYLSEFWYTAKILPDSKIWVSTPTGEVRGEIGYNGEIRAKGTLKKSCLPPRWRLLMGQIIQFLGGKTCGLDQISNKDATILYCLANDVQVDYAKIILEDLIHKLNKKTREKIVPYPRFISLLFEHMAPKYDNEELTINPTWMCLWTPKLLNTLLQLKRFPKAKLLELEVDSEEYNLQNIHLSPPLRHPNPNMVIQKKETKSSLDMDTCPSHPLPLTPVVGKMHKEAHHAAGGPTSLRDTSKDGPHPQLSSGSNPNVLVDKTKYVGDGLKTIHTTLNANKESRADDISRKVKLEDLSDILKDTRSAFFTPDYPTDEPIIISDVSNEEENTENDKDTEDTLVPPPSPKSSQIQELMAQHELSKLLASHDFASCLPTELKELPSKIIRLSGEIKELKQHIKDMEIELPGDLIEIPTKLESFTSTISSLSSQVAELKNIQWKPPTEFLNLSSQVSSVQEKLKTLDSLPNLLHKVSDTLNSFSTVMENASGAASINVPSAGQAPLSLAEGEKNTKDACTNLKNDLIDILGKDVVTQYYTKKLLFDKYCDKILKR
ncbi:hypothetical protein Tco_1554316 [Tanacetum coccineum]